MAISLEPSNVPEECARKIQHLPSPLLASGLQSQDGRVTESLSGLEIMVITTVQFMLLLFKICSRSTLKVHIG